MKNERLYWIMYFVPFIYFGCALQSKNNLVELDGLLKKYESSGFSGNVLLIEKDSLLFHKGYGWANKEEKIKNNPSTIFPYGSIVKDYTRAAIFLLAKDSLLQLHDSLYQYFPDIPPDKKDITITQLLEHTSGLDPYHDQGNSLREKWPEIPGDFMPMTKTEALEYIFNQRLLFKPGSQFSYSNSGYTLLAIIIEIVTNEKYEVVIKSKILQPAGMTTTDFYQSPLWTETDVAIGYGPKKFGKKNSPVYWPRNPYPLLGNGGMAGTLMDFYKGLRYMNELYSLNPIYASPVNDFEQNTNMPENIISSAGGNDFGFVSVIFGLKSEGKLLIFTTNNDDDGKEDLEMLSEIIKVGMGFDLMSLSPGNQTDDNSDAVPVERSAKWNFPDKPHWNRTSVFLEFIEGKDEGQISPFIKKNCTSSYEKSKSESEHKELFIRLMQLSPFKLKQAAYETPNIELTILSNEKSYALSLVLTNNNQRLINNIQLVEK